VVKEDFPRKKLQSWFVTSRSQVAGSGRPDGRGMQGPAAALHRGMEAAAEQVVRNEPGRAVRGGF